MYFVCRQLGESVAVALGPFVFHSSAKEAAAMLADIEGLRCEP